MTDKAPKAEDVAPLVYNELRRVAAAYMRRERPGQTLQATALVHEAWLRLVGQNNPQWENSRHFFSAAAEAMRRILVERARRKGRIRHGGEWQRLNFTSIESLDIAREEQSETILFLNEALEKLAAQDPECAELIKLRFFAGVPNHSAATILGLSERTAKRNWAYARAWLAREIIRLRNPQ